MGVSSVYVFEMSKFHNFTYFSDLFYVTYLTNKDINLNKATDRLAVDILKKRDRHINFNILS